MLIFDLEQQVIVGIFKEALDKYNNIIPQLFYKKVEIFIPLEVLAWVMTACWVLHSRLIYFWSNINIINIFYFSKSTSTNTQHSSLWDTLKMMLFTRYLIKWKHVGKISWKFRKWLNLKFYIKLDIKKIDVILVQCPFKVGKRIWWHHTETCRSASPHTRNHLFS